MEHQHEQEIQHDVDAAGHRQKKQRRPAVTQPLKDTSIDVIAQIADDSGKNHHQIDMGFLIYALRHLDKPQDGAGGQQSQQGQRQDAHHQRAVHRVHRPADPVPVPCAEKLRDQDAGAHSHSDKQRGE